MSLGGISLSTINTSYQKLPFGSGDDSDKLHLLLLYLIPGTWYQVSDKRRGSRLFFHRTLPECYTDIHSASSLRTYWYFVFGGQRVRAAEAVVLVEMLIDSPAPVSSQHYPTLCY